MFEGGRDPLTDARLNDLVMRVDQMLTSVSPLIRVGLRVAMFVLWISPVLVGMHLSTLPRLPIAKRTRVLQRLERSRFTSLLLVFVGVRALMTMIFYEDAAELSHMGYRATDETRYVRHLGVLNAARAPAPAESGVRLREDRGAENHDADESGENVIARDDVA